MDQGENDIALLMNQLREERGYGEDNVENSSSFASSALSSSFPASAEPHSTYVHSRLLSELVGYPNNSYFAGSHSIWNPYVCPGDVSKGEGLADRPPSTSVPSYLPSVSFDRNKKVRRIPTNPHVEVIRRRAFEKFKMDSTELLQRIQKEWGVKLPIPSMLEKWHMDAKHDESQQEETTSSSQNLVHVYNQESIELESADDDDSSDDDDNESNCGQESHESDLPLFASTGEIWRLWTKALSKETYQRKDSPNPTKTARKSENLVQDPILLPKQAAQSFRSLALEPEVAKVWSKTKATTMTHPRVHDKGVQQSLPPKFGRKAQQVQKALYRFICEAQNSFYKQLQQATLSEQQQQHNHRHPYHSSKSSKLPRISRDDERDQFKVTFAGISFKVHAAYYEKLQRLFDRQQCRPHSNPSHPTTMTSTTFEEALFCLLCRYDMLQGAGLQAGVPGRVMDVLLEYFDCRMECFASPLNCRYERFASAFEVDRAFGSLGSFFSLEFGKNGHKGGCYQANPPFCEGVIDALNQQLTLLLRPKAITGESNTTKGNDSTLTTTSHDKNTGRQEAPPPLMFVVFVPAWKESKAYKDGLLENEFLTEHLLLKQGHHWYAEGTQHRRKDSFRVASFDTSVLFYQNDAAKSKWPVTKAILEALRVAFCSDPGFMDKSITSGILASSTASLSKKRVIAAKKDLGITLHKTETTILANHHDGKNDTDCTKEGTNSSTNTVKMKKRKGSKTEPKPRKKKQRWANEKEESSAQMSLLKSLGLSSTPPEVNNPVDNPSTSKATSHRSKKGEKNRRSKK